MVLLLNVVAVEYTRGFCSKRLQNTRDIHLTESDAVDHGNCAIRILKVPNTFHTSKAVTSCTTSSLISTSCTNMKYSEAVSHCRNNVVNQNCCPNPQE